MFFVLYLCNDKKIVRVFNFHTSKAETKIFSTTNFSQITVTDLGSITFLAKIVIILVNVQI